MQYLGGKSRTARQIAGYLNLIREPGQPYWEPFVGAGWILERIRGTGPVYASDANPYLIAMWQALQAGWEPPGVVTEAEYQAIKDDKDAYPPELVAFVGFGCSFGGKWFAGYAHNRPEQDYAQCAYNALSRKSSLLADIDFFVADFLTCSPPAHASLIYCDPPYENSTGYGAVPDWNSDAFWRRARWLSEHGHTVIVSEYQAPADFVCNLTMQTGITMHTNNGRNKRTERLFRYGDHAPLQPALF